MSKYSRVSNSEDVQEVELQVPSYEEATSIVNNNGSLGEFSILNKIKRKPNNNNNSGGGGAPHSTDGVFSNLSAKPETEAEKEEENPPPYEAAAADATPPYWETTIIAPGLMGDEVLVEGLPVGNFFSFVWNMLVSMSFQFVGFLLTYLLHTSHAAKAGLGITLVQYGFYLRGKSLQDAEYYNYSDDDSDKDGLAKNEWLSYILMSLGWFIVIRSVTNYVRVKRVETIMRTTPEENV
ncbi:7679_t:CDS:2 [Entrophospora sp. SA101]|nr:7679_t:CDS:2 [Entrophospora sp. SA101]CAJ0918495.1 12423_t:CDS:2 [Entrophospora sp. SA101]CAJ0918518.1 1430_t:CDS:2 [Entrophospora sp. SA101]CAJ0918533.1 1435_t:CDS:2 [Entrophospora sp. SA101]CAJ0918546.1 1440_t:CDS:2 [Entrophospora sp. SA101]